MNRSILIAVVAGATPVTACDLCAIYSASQAHGEVGKGPFLGAAEQFTYFGTLQYDGTEVPNRLDQYMNSSISQVFAGYNFSDRVGVQFNLPVIYRSYRRPDEMGGIDEGTESGLGDVALLGNVIPFSRETRRFTFRWNVAGGVKFPTGNTDRLQEEFNEVEDPVGPPSAIHGHDLTLGSGSFDGIVGTGIFTRWRRAFLTASMQYAIRSEGDYDYQFANDLTWIGGPGIYAMLSETHTLALQVVVSGEHKGLDAFQGMPEEDTGLTSVYLGPEINFTWRENLGAFLGVDVPVSIDNTGLQIVPDYRVRAGLTWRF